MDLWDEVRKLKGNVLKTLDRGHPFKIIEIQEKGVIVLPSATNKERLVMRNEIEGAYRELTVTGRITRTQIEANHSLRIQFMWPRS